MSGPDAHNETVNPAELTAAEHLLWNAFPRAAWVDLSGTRAGAPGVIRAEVIAALLLGAAPGEPGSKAGIRLRGATVVGPLDLTSGTVAHPLVCEGCLFDTELRLVDSSVRTVRILDSELPGLDGSRLRLDGILDLTGSRIAGAVRLEHAKVSGQLRMRASRAGAGLEAVAATGLFVDGDVDCARLEANGEVDFRAANVAGTLDLTGARIAAPGRRGLVLSYASIGGKLECRDLAVEGETRANNCRVAAHLSMSAARLDNPAGVAFFAGGMHVGGGAFFRDGFSATGEFRLIGAHLAANLALEGGTFDNPGGVAVTLEGAVAGSVYGDGLACHGQWSMIGARINGDVSLARAVLESGEGTCVLNAERTQIDGTLVLQEVKALGEVNLRSIRVGERLILAGAELRNPSSTAIEAEGLQAKEFLLEPGVQVEGGVDFRHAAIGVLHDDPAAWPAHLYLDGLTYQALYPRLPAGQRLSWLARDPGGHQSQPYEQLAANYTAIGQPGQARDVLYARERIQHQGKGPVSRTWGLLQDITVGYGYRPRRALGWLALLLTAGSIVFSIAPPPVLEAGNAPHFNGIVYTLDLMLPVVNLGQKYAFNPGGAQQWLSYFLIAAGWTLATTVAAGLARILRRG
jgi:hypothetical protein